jgi:CRISPR-associated protein Cmr4
MKTIDFYLIQAISNLHVGSGEGDFSVIDKQVQRDPVNKLPVIHASGIKGALREAMQFSNTGHNKVVEAIFGADSKKKDGKIQQGLNNFFEGKLLALPIRSTHDYYYIATCPYLLNSLISDLKIFNLHTHDNLINQLTSLAEIDVKPDNPNYFGTNYGKLTLENWEAHYNQLELPSEVINLLGERLALLHNDAFKSLASELPIIARNYLENGISRNLWYEEVVPRESLFYTMISRHEDNDNLNNFLKSKGNLVQIGANATVGYGLCKFNII